MPEMTATEIAETIIAAGLDHHDFKCQAVANRLPFLDDANIWEQIAEMARPNCPEAAWLRAWELSGEPIPEDYLKTA